MRSAFMVVNAAVRVMLNNGAYNLGAVPLMLLIRDRLVETLVGS
jgi:hypothetical protein